MRNLLTFLIVLTLLASTTLCQMPDSLMSVAKAGDSEAQYRVGKMYYDGTSIEKNDSIAVEWFRLSAEQGNVKAQTLLGINIFKNAQFQLYKTGQLQDSVYLIAEKWLQSAAAEGWPIAMYWLGRLYDPDAGGGGNLAFRQDDPPEQNPEGYNRVPEDWYLECAEAGYVKCQRSLAWLYMAGWGNKTDRVDFAHNWNLRAAKQGNAIAQMDVSYLFLYPSGIAGFEVDSIQAYFWSALATRAKIAGSSTYGLRRALPRSIIDSIDAILEVWEPVIEWQEED